MSDIMKWSPGEVAEKILDLTQNELTANIFLEQSINGEALLELSESDLKELQIKLGPRKIITKFLHELKCKSTVILESIPIDNLHKILQEEKNEEIIMFENTATSSQHLSQNIFNEITGSIGPNKVLSTKNLLEDHPQQFSSQSEANLNIFSRYGTVEKTLENHEQGVSILKAIRKGSFNESDRKALVRIVVAELILAQNNYYPPDKVKVSLASAIVSEFPLLKNNVTGCNGYEHYYDPKTRQGFIEFRLWTVRTKLSPQKKKYSSMKRKAQCLEKSSSVSNNDVVVLDKHVLEEKILWMKHKLPSDSNKELIKKCLKETFSNRRQWIISSGPVISNIFEKYPRLLDYNGEMIEQDFNIIYPNCEDNFLAKFPSYYTTKILGYIIKYRPDIMKKTNNLPVNDDALRALIALTLLLPPSNSLKKINADGPKNKGKKLQKRDKENILNTITEVPNPHLIKIFPEGTNLPYTEQNLRTETDGNVQPYIMCILGQEKNTFFVQGDGWFFMLPHRATPIAAFDLLFKLYQVLHVSYPLSLLNFYNFIESFIYLINVNPSNTVSSLHINICNVVEDAEVGEPSREV
ncbi:uncharacterized protein LOC118644388 isoform X3 [Monomorium pharaonis]|uniref:uncharacterized protein LOC118644388 isoform X3 n=2 Tax=Monomorium pharaonis TaxID=307658 RepID=UPI0017477361|nr:uncharacterized protein LOC118644388 isoform X3 [Monomorium pharaonis]